MIALKYALLVPVSQRSYGYFLNMTDSVLSEQDKSSPFNSTHNTVLYPQNGDGIMTIDSAHSLHSVYSSKQPTDTTENAEFLLFSNKCN